MEFDYLIVGAGLTGCVFAERIHTQLKKTVLLVDLRDHIGGNVYDYYNEHGILIHKYGPHWFHTNDKKVFQYLSLFTEWRFHTHKVKTFVDGMLLPFPINRDTINQLYNENYNTPEEVSRFFESVRDKSITRPENAEEMVVSKIGWDLYNKFYKNYTLKQWDINPKELAPSITARIPIRTDTNDGYFSALYEGLPKFGYTEMLKKMIMQNGISILLNTDYKQIIDSVKFKKLIYTGPIDYFFDNVYGPLPYRSLRFEHETMDKEFHQEVQQINYPNEFNYTRITEWKHATGQKHSKTTITKEYPFLATETSEKYYPIPTKVNNNLYNKYLERSLSLRNIIFCGRLADYKYYNMDQVVARALKKFETGVATL